MTSLKKKQDACEGRNFPAYSKEREKKIYRVCLILLHFSRNSHYCMRESPLNIIHYQQTFQLNVILFYKKLEKMKQKNTRVKHL